MVLVVAVELTKHHRPGLRLKCNIIVGMSSESRRLAPTPLTLYTASRARGAIPLMTDEPDFGVATP